MAFLYYNTRQVPTTIFTSLTPDFELDILSFKAGARDVRIVKVDAGGTAAAATAVSGIAFRFKRFTTAASVQLLPYNPDSEKDPGSQVGKVSIGAVNSQGTGGPVFLGGFTLGAGGPGGWRAREVSAGMGLEGNSNQSIDTFVASSLAGASFTYTTEFVE